ncbi:hypothetical protein, partial [Acidithiobacillus thiooxidans]|uniref:hypothetical protein n=1 Tax=Acidithiobacillus thiooxidans TaxID=930 RepID=UPI001C077806
PWTAPKNRLTGHSLQPLPRLIYGLESTAVGQLRHTSSGTVFVVDAEILVVVRLRWLADLTTWR